MTSASPICVSRHQQLVKPKTYQPKILNTAEEHEHEDRDQTGDAHPHSNLLGKEELERRNNEKRQDNNECARASPEEDALLGSKILNRA
eukprot:CAMPEP_0194313336 /NCGR_PEP_ID=MMETSP0171-20130528/10227_1 /TAXON_ID=218684 /ORGANISM="Corethron pennatum, Strain L29A3" /LENGTH=88 /DNA_ID=CAMNT_0039068251 /DNA_START=29 /DNA_END=291 /DNA_ORIENTATION=+